MKPSRRLLGRPRRVAPLLALALVAACRAQPPETEHREPRPNALVARPEHPDPGTGSANQGTGNAEPRTGHREPRTANVTRAAFRIVDLASGVVRQEAHPEALSALVLPGSILKIPTMLAALQTGAITERTAIVCRRTLNVDGHELVCSHPDLGRGLTPAEALAHSCNYYVATVARRISRDALNGVLLTLGLPPIPASAPFVASALGLDGATVTPLTLFDMLRRLVEDRRIGTEKLASRAEHREPGPGTVNARAVVLAGLRGSVAYGTAAAVGQAGIDGFGKTGTAPKPGGGYQGLFVLVAPADRPTTGLVIVAPGAAGADAAAMAGDLLRDAATVGGQSTAIRLGVTTGSGGVSVVTADLEEYVARVVSGEAASGSGAAALRALAVTARTFALANRGRHAKEGFDLCDLTHCQVTRAATTGAAEAARSTSGQVLFYGGQLAEVFYTAGCGGRTEDADAVWPQKRLPYLAGKDDPYCRDAPAWTSEIDERELVRALVASGRRGDAIRDLAIVARTASQRVKALRVDGLVPPRISGEELRLAIGRALGWYRLKSAAFDVERIARGYRFTGRGGGHGVGLCLAGSSRMAAEGRSTAEIFSMYFPGLQVARLTEVGRPPRAPGATVRLPSQDESERSEIQAVVAAALRSVSGAAGVEPRESIRLRFHPTVESYRRATGRPWWIAASTAGLQVDLLPVLVLRRRGILERTIRHEIAHVVTEPALAGRPLWVREGAAAYFAEGPIAIAAADCPSDEDLGAAPSDTAARAAYDRAAACFANELANGTRWTDVGR